MIRRIHGVVTVLHSHPIKSAEDAAKAAIVQEFRDFEPE